MRQGRQGATLLMMLAVASAMQLAGCIATGPDLRGVHDRLAAFESAHSDLIDLLRFATWVRSASPAQLHHKRLELERDAGTDIDGTSLIRLSLVLHALRAPTADSERARELLVGFLDDPETAGQEDARALALFLLGSWDEQSRHRLARDAAEEQARRQRAAYAEERRLRTLAEQRLDALINVERRARRGRDFGAEIKPVPP